MKNFIIRCERCGCSVHVGDVKKVGNKVMKEGASEVRMILTNDDTVIIKKGAAEDVFKVQEAATEGGVCLLCDVGDVDGRCVIERSVECGALIGLRAFLKKAAEVNPRKMQPSLPDELL